MVIILAGTFDGAIGFLVSGALCLVLWYGGKLVNEGTLSAGVLTCEFCETFSLCYRIQFSQNHMLTVCFQGCFLGTAVRSCFSLVLFHF